jgi:hypothetical protein
MTSPDDRSTGSMLAALNKRIGVIGASHTSSHTIQPRQQVNIIIHSEILPWNYFGYNCNSAASRIHFIQGLGGMGYFPKPLYVKPFAYPTEQIPCEANNVLDVTEIPSLLMNPEISLECSQKLASGVFLSKFTVIHIKTVSLFQTRHCKPLLNFAEGI